MTLKRRDPLPDLSAALRALLLGLLVSLPISPLVAAGSGSAGPDSNSGEDNVGGEIGSLPQRIGETPPWVSADYSGEVALPRHGFVLEGLPPDLWAVVLRVSGTGRVTLEPLQGGLVRAVFRGVRVDLNERELMQRPVGITMFLGDGFSTGWIRLRHGGLTTPARPLAGPVFALPLERLQRAGLFEDGGVRIEAIEAVGGHGSTSHWRLARTSYGLSIF